MSVCFQPNACDYMNDGGDYDCPHCGAKISSDNRGLFLPTLSVSSVSNVSIARRQSISQKAMCESAAWTLLPKKISSPLNLSLTCLQLYSLKYFIQIIE